MLRKKRKIKGERYITSIVRTNLSGAFDVPWNPILARCFARNVRQRQGTSRSVPRRRLQDSKRAIHLYQLGFHFFQQQVEVPALGRRHQDIRI